MLLKHPAVFHMVLSAELEGEHAVHFVQNELTFEDAKQWWQDLQSGVPHEVLMAQYFQKRAQKRKFHPVKIHP